MTWKKVIYWAAPPWETRQEVAQKSQSWPPTRILKLDKLLSGQHGRPTYETLGCPKRMTRRKVEKAISKMPSQEVQTIKDVKEKTRPSWQPRKRLKPKLHLQKVEQNAPDLRDRLKKLKADREAEERKHRKEVYSTASTVENIEEVRPILKEIIEEIRQVINT